MGTALKVGSLCSGYGGLELGLQAAGIRCDTVWVSETDSKASSVLAARYPAAPNLGDLTEITDPTPVDIVTAGFPCQPVSVAGKRKGIDDERWLIDDVCKIAGRAGADWLILENVSGILSANNGNAMARTVSALAANGFSAEWACVRASDVGAAHKRLRWFCLAHANGSSSEAWRNAGYVDSEFWPQLVGFTSSSADSHMPRRGEHGGSVAASEKFVSAEHFGDLSARFGSYAAAIARWEPIVGRPAPEPTDGKRRLNPKFVEWMMGLPDGWVTDIVSSRTHSLRILGNGVVPQQAAYALHLLAKNIEQARQEKLV